MAEWQGLVSDEHFSVDGTLIEAWTSMKSFVKKDGTTPPPEGGGRNSTVVFKGKTRSNDTHQSTTDPDARLYKKSEGDKSRLCYLGHALMENRNGLAVRDRGVTPHVAKKAKGSAIDGRTTRHPGYKTSLIIRKRIEEIFGRAKTVGGLRKARFTGLSKVRAQTAFTFAAYNLTRMAAILGWRWSTA